MTSVLMVIVNCSVFESSWGVRRLPVWSLSVSSSESVFAVQTKLNLFGLFLFLSKCSRILWSSCSFLGQYSVIYFDSYQVTEIEECLSSSRVILFCFRSSLPSGFSFPLLLSFSVVLCLSVRYIFPSGPFSSSSDRIKQQKLRNFLCKRRRP